MEHLLFPKNGNWYKGNLHGHTINSDGRKTPEEIAKMYKEKGYSFIAITDHDVFYDHRENLQTNNFITIPAVEGSAYLIDDESHYTNVLEIENANSLDILWDKNKIKKCRQTHHINAFLGTEKMQQNATKPMFKQGEKINPEFFLGEWNAKEVLQKMVKFYQDRGFFVSYNHPLWSRVNLEQITGVDGIWATEIFNFTTELSGGNGVSGDFIDGLARNGDRVFITATDDNHNVNGEADSFGGYIVVKAEALTHENIVEALLLGNYYSSTGCEIYNLEIKENTVYFKCEDCEWIKFIVGDRVGDGAILRNNGDGLCGATYNLKGYENWIRVECKNKQGKMAWTNYVFLQNN